MLDLRNHFRRSGVKVTSHWLDLDLSLPHNEERLSNEAWADLSDIEDADVLILYNPLSHQNKGTGGRHVEMGYALARNKRIIIVGEERENVFQHMREHIFVAFPEGEAISFLASILLTILRRMEDAEPSARSGSV
jgi:nucleoside 2-deoxyribosyltransferase